VDRGRQWTVLRWAAVLGTFCGASVLTLTGAGWGHPAGVTELWFAGTAPLGVRRVGLDADELLASGAQLLVLSCWLGLGLLVRRGLAGARTVMAAAVAGGAPLLAGAPLFSNDAYTYVAVGELLERGRDPYRVGWGALHQPQYLAHVDHVWMHTPSPYSPLLLRLLQLDSHLAGGNLRLGVVLLRVLAVVAFVGLGWAVSRAVGGAAGAAALWLSVANPLLSQQLLSGLHVDLYVALLVVLAVTAHARGHHLGAMLLVALAAQVKVTAVVVAPVLIADVLLAGRLAGSRRWIRAAALAAVGVVAFTALSVAAGLGNGWLHALSVPALGRNSTTGVDALADLAARVGLTGTRPLNEHILSAPASLRTVGFVLAGAVIGWGALRVRRLGVPLAGAAALAAVSGFGASTWPWYLAPAVVLIAVGRPGPKVVLATVATSLAFSLALRPGGGPILLHEPVLADLAVLGLLAGVLALLAFGPGPVRRPVGRSAPILAPVAVAYSAPRQREPAT
jgi:hypothetical protein